MRFVRRTVSKRKLPVYDAKVQTAKCVFSSFEPEVDRCCDPFYLFDNAIVKTTIARSQWSHNLLPRYAVCRASGRLMPSSISLSIGVEQSQPSVSSASNLACNESLEIVGDVMERRRSTGPRRHQCRKSKMKPPFSELCFMNPRRNRSTFILGGSVNKFRARPGDLEYYFFHCAFEYGVECCCYELQFPMIRWLCTMNELRKRIHNR